MVLFGVQQSVRQRKEQGEGGFLRQGGRILRQSRAEDGRDANLVAPADLQLPQHGGWQNQEAQLVEDVDDGDRHVARPRGITGPGNRNVPILLDRPAHEESDANRHDEPQAGQHHDAVGGDFLLLAREDAQEEDANAQLGAEGRAGVEELSRNRCLHRVATPSCFSLFFSP
jgi:hypothetical protein